MFNNSDETVSLDTSNDNSIVSNLYSELQTVRGFDPHQQALLGTYIYALRDPRDNKVFYVGQGQNNRLFAHFETAEAELKSGKTIQSIGNRKIRRILDIWLDGCSVEWSIIAANTAATQGTIADKIESAVYDAVTWSMNGMLMNEVAPPHSTFLDTAQIADWSAKPVNPESELVVFVCNISALHGTIPDYDVTRQYWKLGQQWRKEGAITHGVGLINGISKTAYQIDRWDVTSTPPNAGKSRFYAPKHPNPDTVEMLINLNWRNVLRGVGYWLRGNPIIVKFDGNGKFIILRGSDTAQWQDCV